MLPMREKTLLDEFASAALIGLLTNANNLGHTTKQLLTPDVKLNVEGLAKLAFEIAEAMLSERQKHG